MNAQCQPHYTWPASFVVARAYLDQLTRGNALPQQRADAIREAMKQVESSTGSARKPLRRTQHSGCRTGQGRRQAPAIDAKRMRDCGSTIQKHNAELE